MSNCRKSALTSSPVANTITLPMKQLFLLLLFAGIILTVFACTNVDGNTSENTGKSVSEHYTANEPDDENGEAILYRNRDDSIPPDAVKISPDDDLYPPILHSDEYREPVPLPAPINSAGGEDSPFIMPDGKTLYFFFTPDVDIPVEGQLIDGVTGIYVAHRCENGSWTKAEKLILNDDVSLDGCAYVNQDKMWFCSVRKGYTDTNWFTVENTNGTWTNLKYSPLNLLDGFEIGELHFSSDGRQLYYHSSRPGGLGGYDIWVTRYIDEEWHEPEHILAVNTPDSEGWPFVSEDGSELWFTRFYRGSPAVFRSKRTGTTWGEPELIISQFAGEPSLDRDGNLYFVHHYYNHTRMIEADIYVAMQK